MGIMVWNLGYEVKRMALKELFLAIQMPNAKNYSFSQNRMYNYFQIDTWKNILKHVLFERLLLNKQKKRKKKETIISFHK